MCGNKFEHFTAVVIANRRKYCDDCNRERRKDKIKGETNV